MADKSFNKVLANWLTNDFQGICKKYGVTPPTSGVTPEDFRTLVSLLYVGVLDKKQLRAILERSVQVAQSSQRAQFGAVGV